MLSPETTENDATFEDFLKAVEPKLKRLLATYRIPKEDAEDLLQQALLALLYQWEQVRDPESWLFGTLKRHCWMYWRARRRRIYSAVDSALLECLSAPIAPSQEHSDLRADLESLIDRLPSRCRVLLRLRFQLGYGPLETANKLGYRASSIGKITTRCLAALTRELFASGLSEGLSNPKSADSRSAALMRR
jgi:RNA polymerase sigma factor (sigma-70 family)